MTISGLHQESVGATLADSPADTIPQSFEPDPSVQMAEDAAVERGLKFVKALMTASGKFPEDLDFHVCADPNEIGISHDSLADMERRGYQNSGYGDRAEGKGLFDDAFRGYRREEIVGDLRFVVVTRTEETSGQRVPIAFFDYFQVTRNLFPEAAAAADAFVAERGLTSEPARYIVSKLVADPSRAKELLDAHRYALVGVLGSLASLSDSGMLLETQAQPATRRMIRKHGTTYIPGLEVLLDQPLPGDRDAAGGERSKLLLYIPPTERA